ncbi:MAG TPA: DEAD/DEAH box helicase [Thermoanaerobaculia bacterium]|jgi:ATP-dependent RNA helicase DeaD|nr:DEAD/DEAH box helicase [Thermoanaerobaculia bacterium]
MAQEEQEEEDGAVTFASLGLSEPILKALGEVGYEAPTPIQERTIPTMLAGQDLIGQAQTGTGKTAAFALPILEKIDLAVPEVQALVLAPTRELAIQVAEAIHTYSKYVGRVGVLPVYGGQPIQLQLKRLDRGVHVVVGTPGRIMDHLRRGSLRLDAVRVVVLDEADEMLRMGFIEDVEWILSQAPEGRQTALFSATLPREIRRIAERHLDHPVSIEIERPTLTVPAIEQRYLNVSPQQKLDALTRILETEPTEAVLIFTRTKTGAAELSERLQGRGYAAEAMHGDMNQAQRESVIRRLKAGQVEIVVATDVAARGLDVERISHVINYDIPNDVEAYVHRIGRTGRAGRSGVAVLFVQPRERRMMTEIERYTGQRIMPMKMPTQADVAARRIALFKDNIRSSVEEGDLDLYLTLVEELVEEGLELAEIAAAAARLARGDKPLEVEVEPEAAAVPRAEDGMVRLFIAAGSRAGVRPGDIVGAIANEAGVPGKAIGSIDIYDRFTFVEIPAQYQDQVLQRMANATIRGRPVEIRIATPERGDRGGGDRPRERGRRPYGDRRPGGGWEQRRR